MPTVQSKYQNPDKFIEKLKDELDNMRKRWRYEQGRWEFTFSEPYEINVHRKGQSDAYPEFFPGTVVKFRGVVTKVTRDQNTSAVDFDIKSCYRIKENA